MLNISPDPSETMLWFDLDDTLWDMWGNSVLCLRELYDAHNLGRWFSSPRQWDDVYHTINRRLWEQYGAGQISREHLREQRFTLPLTIAGASEDEAAAIWRALDRDYLDRLGQKTTLIDGARDLLDYLRRRRYPMGIVSNGFHEVQYNKLKSSAIDSYFDIVILSDDAGFNKPDRRFFDYALDKASSRGKRNIVIGDNLSADIKGATDYGLDAIWFRRNQLDNVPENVIHIDSLSQLKTIL